MKNWLVLGTLAAILAASSYGFSFTLSKLVYDHGTNSLTLVSIRFLALVIVNWCWLRLKGQSLAVPPPVFWLVTGTGVFMFGASGGNLSAIMYVPVSLAILVFYSYPIFTLVFVGLIDRRPPRMIQVGAAVVAIVGIGLALEVSFADLHVVGIGLALLAAASAALNLITAQYAMRNVSTPLMTFYAGIAAFLVAGGVTLGSGALALPQAPAGWGLFATVLGLYCVARVSMFTAVRWIGPVKTALVMCVEPVVAIAFAIVLLGERLTTQQLIGAVLVIGAIAAVQGQRQDQ